jgi:hypothetical protein
MEARHSKQMPIPHNGPRDSPVTDFRQACPAITTATATVVLEGTEMDFPFTVNVTWLGMRKFFPGTRRQIRLNRNFWFRARNLIHENSCSCQ